MRATAVNFRSIFKDSSSGYSRYSRKVSQGLIDSMSSSDNKEF